MTGMDIQTRRVYDPPKPDDGTRILVDGIWPRGVSKRRAHLHRWLRELAPSKALRQSRHHVR
jgi:uncharacterized protein YeaO (DUF488 family)